MIAVVDDSGTAVLDTFTGSLLWKQDHDNRVLACCFSADGSKLVVGGYDEHITIYSAKDGEVLLPPTKCGIVKSLSFSSDGRHLAAGTKHGKIEVFRVDSLESLWKRYIICEFSEDADSPSWKAMVWCADGRSLVACGTYGYLVSLDAISGTQLWRLNLDNKVRALSLSPNGAVLVVGEDGGKVVLVDPATGERDEHYDCGFFIFALFFTPDGASVVVLEGEYHEKKAVLLDLAGGGMRRLISGQLEDHRCDLATVCLSSDGETMVAARGTLGPDYSIESLRISAKTVSPLWTITWSQRVNAICICDVVPLLSLDFQRQDGSDENICTVFGMSGEVFAKAPMSMASTLGDLRRTIAEQSGISKCSLVVGASRIDGDERLLKDIVPDQS